MKKQVLFNLKKNAYSAFSSAIEIHNKPNIEYRYENVTILLLNAWELILKAFVRKYTRKSIFKVNDYTISIDEAIGITKQYLIEKGLIRKYVAYFDNVELLEKYRNSNVHFYNEKGLDGVMFSLIAKNTLDFNQFCMDFFNEDPIGKNNLTILPIGFKLPFNPEQYLSMKNSAYSSNKEIKNFMDKILVRIKDLNDQNIEESLVIGFDVYLSSVKKISNSDLIVAIDQENSDYNVKIGKKVEFSNEPGATKVYLSDDDILNNYPLSYEDVWKGCKNQNPNFKKDNQFQNLINRIKNNKQYCFERKHYPGREKSAVTRMYSKDAIDYVIKNYKTKK